MARNTSDSIEEYIKEFLAFQHHEQSYHIESK